MKIITFEVSEAARECGLSKETIIQFIDENWIEPFDKERLSLDREDIERIRLIAELKDLGVNDESVPIILHLIDQINLLHQGLRS